MSSDIQAQARRHAHVIRHGTLLAIDPASGGTSRAGWAAFKDGKLVDSGTLEVEPGPVQQRLRQLYELLAETDPDVLVIERIRGSRAHVFLHWAVGVSIAACCPMTLLEMPVSSWKKHAGPTHRKGDREDAVAIGRALLAMVEDAA